MRDYLMMGGDKIELEGRMKDEILILLLKYKPKITNNKEISCKISKEELQEIILKQLPNTKYIKNIPNIEKYMINQCEKESSFFKYATRYERHLDDMSIGLYQMLTTTIAWLGLENLENNMFDVETQVEYTLKYIDYLYGKFSEVKDKTERLKMSFASYNMGKGHINKALKKARELEEIHYEGENTIQGKWAKYETVVKMLRKYNIVKNTNIDINERYVNFIFSI